MKNKEDAYKNTLSRMNIQVNITAKVLVFATVVLQALLISMNTENYISMLYTQVGMNLLFFAFVLFVFSAIILVKIIKSSAHPRRKQIYLLLPAFLSVFSSVIVIAGPVFVLLFETLIELPPPNATQFEGVFSLLRDK